MIRQKRQSLFVSDIARTLSGTNNSTCFQGLSAPVWTVIPPSRGSAGRETATTSLQSSLTKKTEPCDVWVSLTNCCARWRSSLRTRTRTHQSPAGVFESRALAGRYLRGQGGGKGGGRGF